MNASSSNPKAVIIVVIIVIVILLSILALLYVKRKEVSPEHPHSLQHLDHHLPLDIHAKIKLFR